MPRPTARDWFLFTLCVVLWGSAYAMVRVGLNHGGTPWEIVAGRLWLATIFLHAFLLWRRARGLEPPRTPRARRKLFVMGFLGAAAPFWLYSWAQLSAPSGIVGLYAAVTPLLVAGAAPFVGERMDAGRAFGLLLGFAGVAALMAPSIAGDGHASVVAQGAAILGAACYAVNTLIARAGVQIPPLEAAAGWTLFGALMATPFAASDWINTGAAPDPIGWIAIAALALGPTGIASIAYFELVRGAGPVFVTQTNYLMPLWALGLGAIAFAEPIGWNALIAFALIAAGLFIAQEGWKAMRMVNAP
ncbi:MAG: DMT family transporter [Hyphomonadaceae bacterium]